MKIPREVIDDIKSRAKIQDVISHYIQVIKKGNNYVAYCPFHDDHDPSLHISSDKQIWKCFSCPAEENSSGDVFSFVGKYKKLSYQESVKEVADLIGYKFNFKIDNKEEFVETNIHKILKESVNYCQHLLNSSQGVTHKKYLLDRGLGEKVLEKFNFGYCPKNNGLSDFLIKKGYKEKDIVDANISRITEKGLSDVFYDRIMIPIFDEDNHPIGFTARSIDPNNDSKYINSTDTAVFNKSNVVFNLNRAKETIREKKFVIITEGPMDVMAFDSVGLANAICTLGTATTKQQLNIIKKYTNRLLLAYDGDKAGQGAVVRTGKIANEMGFQVLVLNNETDLDPDEIIKNYSANELIKMVEKPLTWIEFCLKHYQKEFDLSNYSDKKKYTDKVLTEINQVKDNIDRENYIQKLAKITGFSTAVLTSNTNIINANKQSEAKIVKNNYSNGIELAQKGIISQLLLNKASLDTVKSRISFLPNKDYNTLLNQIINYYNQHEKMDSAEFIQTIDKQLADIIFDVDEDEHFVKEVNRDVLNDCILEIEIYELEEEIREKESKIKTLHDGIIQSKYMGELIPLKLKVKELLNQKTGKGIR